MKYWLMKSELIEQQKRLKKEYISNGNEKFMFFLKKKEIVGVVMVIIKN